MRYYFIFNRRKKEKMFIDLMKSCYIIYFHRFTSGVSPRGQTLQFEPLYDRKLPF